MSIIPHFSNGKKKKSKGINDYNLALRIFVFMPMQYIKVYFECIFLEGEAYKNKSARTVTWWWGPAPSLRVSENQRAPTLAHDSLAGTVWAAHLESALL